MLLSVDNVSSFEPFFMDFFNRLKKELNIELDYKQYSDFLHCLLVTDITDDTGEKLLFLCHTLWMTNRMQQAAFDEVFFQSLHNYRNVFSRPVVPPGEESSNNGMEEPEFIPDPGNWTDTGTDENSQPANALNTGSTADRGLTDTESVNPTTSGLKAEGGAEIRLKVREYGEGRPVSRKPVTGTAYHKMPFIFSNEKILPFPARKTAHALNRLRMPIKYNETQDLDIPGLTRQLLNDGVIHQLMYELEAAGDQRVICLTDHDGSMNPFEAWGEKLVDIMRQNAHIVSLQQFYFHDYPTIESKGESSDFIFFLDQAHTRPVALIEESRRSRWNKQTLIIIFSDAAAAHKKLDGERVKVFYDLVTSLQRITSRITWINPVRKTENAAASYIAYFVNMIYPDFSSFKRAIAGMPALLPEVPVLTTGLFNDKADLEQKLLAKGNAIEHSRLSAFLDTYTSDAHWYFACHLAFPIALTSDLVHQLWVNFQIAEDGQQMELPIHVADEVLHSSLISESGHDIYRMPTVIRYELMNYLKANPKMGPNREIHLAEFMQEYLRFRRSMVPIEALAEAETFNYQFVLLDTAEIIKLLTDLINTAQSKNDPKSQHARQKLEVLLEITKSRENELVINQGGELGVAENVNDPLKLLSSVLDLDRMKTVKGGDMVQQFRNLLKYFQQTSEEQDGFAVPVPQEVQSKLLSEKLIQPTAVTRVYALIVGINNYHSGDFSGCVNDAMNMNDLLNELPVHCAVLVLLDNKATKNAIVHAFQDHLSKAGPNDAVLIYLAGAGTEEWADPNWNEADGKLKSFVCYDQAIENSYQYLINEKEFLYLYQELYKKTSAHIISIYDCARSLGNYPKFMEKKNFSQVRIRSLAHKNNQPFPARSSGQYIFSAVTSGFPIFDDVPRVTLSASEPVGTVIECNTGLHVEGVFTRYLIKELKSSGFTLDYQALEKRISSFTKPIFRQTASVVAYGGHDLLTSKFLNLRITIGLREKLTPLTSKNWQLNLGAIHGITKNTRILESLNGRKGKKAVQFSIDRIHTTFAIVSLSLPEQPGGTISPGDEMWVEVYDTSPNPTRIFIRNYDGNPQVLNQIAEVITKETKGYIQFQKSETESDFVLQCRNGQTYFTLPDDAYRPIVEPVLAAVDNEIKMVTRVAIHLAKWRYIRELKKSGNLAGGNPLKIEIYKNDRQTPLAEGPESNTFHIYREERTEDSGSNVGGTFKIRVTNISNQRLYVAALYLSDEFRIYPDLVPNRVQFLRPGEHFYLEHGGKTSLNFTFSQLMIDYNLKETSEYIQFLFDTESFNADSFELEPLPMPFRLEERYSRNTRGLEIESKTEETIQLPSINVQLVRLTYQNPQYNLIDMSRLSELLDYRETSDFARGIYYYMETDEYLQPACLRLHPAIELRGTTNFDYSKISIKDKLIESSRWRLYEQAKQAHKTRVVAFGDSWFNYPLILRDTIDNLAGSFAMHAILNNQDHLEGNGTFLKERISREKASFLLLSSGMFELFTHYFPECLSVARQRDRAPLKHASLIGPRFYDAVFELKETVRKLLDELTKHFPHLQIIVHGYDYFIPEKINSSAKSWLGTCLTNAGISNHEERKLILKQMVDVWNAHLASITGEFEDDRVMYLDLRNTLGETEWYDELHPNDDGFRRIAEKFEVLMENIDERTIQKQHSLLLNSLLQVAQVEFNARKNRATEAGVFDSTDPQLGLWGSSESLPTYPEGATVSGPYRFSAMVINDPNIPHWFKVILKVEKEQESHATHATFILHDTFNPMFEVIAFEEAVCELTIYSYEAFTAGVLISDGVSLELNLQFLPEEFAPKEFKY